MAAIQFNQNDMDDHVKKIEAIKKPYYEALEKYKALHLRELYDQTIANIEVLHSEYVCEHIELLLDQESYNVIKTSDFNLPKPEF